MTVPGTKEYLKVEREPPGRLPLIRYPIFLARAGISVVGKNYKYRRKFDPEIGLNLLDIRILSWRRATRKDFEGREIKMMDRRSLAKFIWIPRALSMAFILFLMLFSLDVFGGEGNLFLKILGFVIHSLPSLIMLAILVLNWNKPLKCGWLFLAVGALFTLRYGTYNRADTFALISVPPFLVGALFLLTHMLQNRALK
jgi:hypothetical protein